MLREPDSTLGPYREGTSVFVTATFKDNLGVAIPGSTLVSCTYTLYTEVSPYGVINTRDHVDVKSFVTSQGKLDLELTPADMVCSTTRVEENHRVRFEWVWNVDKRGSYEVRIRVSNVQNVP